MWWLRALSLALLSTTAVAASPQAGDGGVGPVVDAGMPKAGPVVITPSASMPTTYDDRFCRGCHNKVTDEKYQHSQMKGGNCYDCHLPANRPSGCKGIVMGQSKTAEPGASYTLEVSLVGWRLIEPEPKLCQSCHEGIASDPPVHRAVTKGGCTVCHAAHSSPYKKMLKGAGVCRSCHRASEKKFVHEPVAKGDCMACHDPHSGLEDPLLKDTRAAICDSCHERKKLTPARHRGTAQCLECHLAHASDEPFLLKPRQVKKGKAEPTPVSARPEAATYPDAPCAQCHKELTAKKFRHSFFKDGTCGECHLPSEKKGACQGPVGQGWKLRQPDPELCLACHDGVQADTALHKVIGMRGCSACHDPHSSNVKKELRLPVEQLCKQCHQRKDTGINSHLVVVQGQCTKCHDPHSGVSNPLLKDDLGALCVECHDQKKLMPESQQHEPVAKGRCPECHDPHGSNRPRMLLAEGKALCLKCHATDAKTASGAAAAKTQLSLSGPKSVHNPVRTDDCQACHVQTHSGREKKLLIQSGTGLCLSCHDGLANNTPMHKPILDKGCGSCHFAHSSDHKKLLTKWPVEALCHSCHEQKDTKELLTNVHTPVKEGKCLDCHDPHAGEEAPLLKSTRAELCFECHPMKDLAKMPVVHSAVKEGRCMDCHDAHGSDSKKMLVADGTQLCMRCHDAKKPDRDVMSFARVDLTRAVVHKPVREKDCQTCHEVGHSAKVRKLLKKQPAKLCLDCHDAKDKTAAVHGAVTLGDCTVCHQPHSSDQKNLLPWAREAKVCFECHEDDVSARAVIHKPVAEGKCNKCHDPHGAPFVGNLKVGPGRDLCLKCHEKVQVNVKVKHKPMERYGCIGCHDPHGAANPTMLTKKVNDLCNGCHRDKSDGQHVSTLVRGGHLVSGDSDPRRQDREFSCASCHNPHGSDNPKLFYWGRDGFEMCDGCHGDRMGNNPALKDISKQKRPRLPDGGVPVSGANAPRGPVAWLLPDDAESDGGTQTAGSPHAPNITLTPSTPSNRSSTSTY